MRSALRWERGARVHRYNLSSRRTFLENVIVNRSYSSKRFTSYLGAGHTDSKCFFHAYHQLQRVNGIQAESIWAKKW